MVAASAVVVVVAFVVLLAVVVRCLYHLLHRLYRLLPVFHQCVSIMVFVAVLLVDDVW